MKPRRQESCSSNRGARKTVAPTGSDGDSLRLDRTDRLGSSASDECGCHQSRWYGQAGDQLQSLMRRGFGGPTRGRRASERRQCVAADNG